MKLVHEATNVIVQKGEKLKSFRDEDYVHAGGTAPRTPESSGRVLVKPASGGGSVEYYPSVFGLKWVPDSQALEPAIHPELADGVNLDQVVALLKRCSYTLDMIPRRRLPDGSDSYQVAAAIDRAMPRDRRKS